ncbi:MAG: WbqC family protein [Bacteroidia bacterium]|nr:WbqC family protein [Bacteroidia bacterium]
MEQVISFHSLIDVTVITTACYFPPAVFFKYFLSADTLLLDSNEYFIKQTLRNRAYICGANGKFPLIVPVKHTRGKLTMIKDICISFDSPWQKIHWRSLTSAYRNSPFFEYCEDELAPFFFKQERFLLDLNEKILQTLFSLMKINPAMLRTEKYIKQYSEGENDLRSLSDPSLFFDSINKENIIPYPQVFNSANDFIPGLSMLDLLFNEGKDSLMGDEEFSPPIGK